MKYYHVIVWAYPGGKFKVEREYTRIERSSFAAAISEAVKRYRQDIGRTKIEKIMVTAQFICAKQGV